MCFFLFSTIGVRIVSLGIVLLAILLLFDILFSGIPCSKMCFILILLSWLVFILCIAYTNIFSKKKTIVDIVIFKCHITR